MLIIGLTIELSNGANYKKSTIRFYILIIGDIWRLLGFFLYQRPRTFPVHPALGSNYTSWKQKL